MIPFVNLKRQYETLKPELERAMRQVFADSQFIQGEAVSQFEREFANYCGARFARGVGSGTDALRLGLLALQLETGSEVLVGAHTFYSCASTIIECGLRPVFVDCTQSGELDTADLARRISPKTRAIMVVHMYGQAQDMDAIAHVIQRTAFRIHIIEDCAQAHGATYKGQKVGTFGSVAAFSFYPTKNLGAYGDGGAVVTNSSRIARRVERAREYGQTKKYHHASLGTNSRLDSLQAAWLRVKLTHLDAYNRQRQALAAQYRAQLGHIPEIEQPINDAHRPSVYHLYTITCMRRNELQKHLLEEGIQTQIHYPIPLHMQAAFAHLGYKSGDFRQAKKRAQKTLSLPIYPELSQNEVTKITHTIAKWYEKK